MKEASRRARGLFKGIGFPSLSRELRLKPRSGRDPNGYYEALGLTPWCTDREIKQAYRRKAKECHPDTGSGSVEEFQAVSRAYEVLSKRRSDYDHLPEGIRIREPGETPIETLVRTKANESSQGSYSYYYEEEPVLPELWYKLVLEDLDELGYRGRVKILFGSTVASGFVSIPPQLEPSKTVSRISSIIFSLDLISRQIAIKLKGGTGSPLTT